METMETSLPSGHLLQGPRHVYLLGACLGKGGFGITYRGQEMATGFPVAVKEYFPSLCKPVRMQDGSIVPSPQFQAAFAKGKNSFLNEAAMLKALDEIPSVVKILDFFSENGTAYMVMEYLDGVTLRSRVEQSGPIPIQTLLPPMLSFIQDISAMHQRGVLHRDIAPDNIMWMPDGSFKLLDFGCARAMEDGRSMSVLLKPGFAPFEQYQTRGQGDYTDLYALCATIYYCITGLVPPQAPERIFALHDGQPDPLPAPSKVGVRISPAWEALLMWGLAADPHQRPKTVAQWLERLEIVPPVPDDDPPLPDPVDDPHIVWPKKSGLSPLGFVILGLCGAGGLAILAFLIHLL